MIHNTLQTSKATMSDSSVLSSEPSNSSKREPEAYRKVAALALFWEVVTRGTTDDETKVCIAAVVHFEALRVDTRV